jgi:hypothetical protein
MLRMTVEIVCKGLRLEHPQLAPIDCDHRCTAGPGFEQAELTKHITGTEIAKTRLDVPTVFQFYPAGDPNGAASIR